MPAVRPKSELMYHIPAHICVPLGLFVQVPNVSWKDVGGLEDVKRELQETVQVSRMPNENSGTAHVS